MSDVLDKLLKHLDANAEALKDLNERVTKLEQAAQPDAVRSPSTSIPCPACGKSNIWINLGNGILQCGACGVGRSV